MVVNRWLGGGIVQVLLWITFGNAQALAGEAQDMPEVGHTLSVGSVYQPGRDVRGESVVGPDLPAPAPTATAKRFRLVIPVRPPAGPEGIELELDEVFIEGLGNDRAGEAGHDTASPAAEPGIVRRR